MLIFESFKRILFTWFYTSLDRYFYSQLLMNYIIGVSFFSCIIMINELYYLIRLYFEQNVPFFHVMNLYISLMPFLISFSIPFGVLPAYLLLLGRLSQDSELVAMRACGISQFRVMLPGVIFGIVIAIFAFAFKNWIEVESTAYYAQLRAKILSQKPVVQLLDNVFLNIGTVQVSFAHATHIDNSDDVLHNVYAVDVGNRRTIKAEKGRIYASPDNPEHYIIKFLDGDMNQISYKTNTTKPLHGDFKDDDFDPSEQKTQEIIEEFYLSSFGSMTLHNYVWLPNDGFFKGPDTMTYKELKEFIDKKDINIENKKNYRTIESNKNIINNLEFTLKYFPYLLYAEADDHEDLVAISNFIESNQGMISEYQDKLKKNLYEMKSRLPNYDIMKLYEKLSLPVAAFIFALLSLPLGMFSARSGRGEGLSISLVVVLVFYGFKSALENMIAQNKVPPEYIWLPTIFFGVIGLILYIRKIIE